MIIQPGKFLTKSLHQSSRGGDICEILATAINSADAGLAVKKHVTLQGRHLIIDHKDIDLEKYRRLFVVGAGKAAVPMATALYEILGSLITAGIVVTKKGHRGLASNTLTTPFSICEASHPIPDTSNLDASKKVTAFLHDLDRDDLILCLFSGGGSALLMRPSPGISLQDLQVTTQLLLSSGADIGEINTIRKHLDEFKGGGLAKIIHPATIVSLILSDVVGDYLDQIASGPTVADSTTYQDAWAIFNKYQLVDHLPTSVLSRIQDGVGGKISETLKPGDPITDNIQNTIVGSNKQAATAAKLAAESFGFFSILDISPPLQGEASRVGEALPILAKSRVSSHSHGKRPACFITGGETTVTIHGIGEGGRNQELALGAVKSLSGDDQMILVSLATDGGDGPTDAAGAVVTNQTYQHGLSMGLDPIDYLENNNSYHYFERMGDLIKTGPTLTNVNDLVFIFWL